MDLDFTSSIAPSSGGQGIEDRLRDSKARTATLQGKRRRGEEKGEEGKKDRRTERPLARKKWQNTLQLITYKVQENNELFFPLFSDSPVHFSKYEIHGADDRHHVRKECMT